MSKSRLAAVLLLVIAVTHYGYDPIAMYFPEHDRAARALFYCLRGMEGVVLFSIISIMARAWMVSFVCAWGITEESQTVVCRLAKGIGEKTPEHTIFSGLCGPEWYVAGCIIALVISAFILDRGLRK